MRTSIKLGAAAGAALAYLLVPVILGELRGRRADARALEALRAEGRPDAVLVLGEEPGVRLRRGKLGYPNRVEVVTFEDGRTATLEPVGYSTEPRDPDAVFLTPDEWEALELEAGLMGVVAVEAWGGDREALRAWAEEYRAR